MAEAPGRFEQRQLLHIAVDVPDPFGGPLAPLAGLVLAFGNRASAGLPARFVLMSAGLLPHVLLNVPLSVALLTHGTAILFLLWYVTPCGLFEVKA